VFGLLLAGAFSAGLVGSFPQNALDHLQVALLEASVLQTQWGDDYIISSLPGLVSLCSVKVYNNGKFGEPFDSRIIYVKILDSTVDDKLFGPFPESFDIFQRYESWVCGYSSTLTTYRTRNFKEISVKRGNIVRSLNDLIHNCCLYFGRWSSSPIIPNYYEYITFRRIAPKLDVAPLYSLYIIAKQPSPFNMSSSLSGYGTSLSSLHTQNSGFGSSLSSPSGDGCNYQGCYDSSGSEATDVKRVSRPINLILCRLRSTPLYAKIVLFGTLGLVAGIWINIGLRRCFLKQSGGRRLLVGSFLVYLITIGWVFLIG